MAQFGEQGDLIELGTVETVTAGESRNVMLLDEKALVINEQSDAIWLIEALGSEEAAVVGMVEASAIALPVRDVDFLQAHNVGLHGQGVFLDGLLTPWEGQIARLGVEVDKGRVLVSAQRAIVVC